MGLTKQYLRFRPTETFGVIASNRSNIIFVTINGIEGRYAAVGGAENILIWDLRTGEKFFEFQSKAAREEVTCLATNRQYLAVGYVSGAVEVFDLETRESLCRLSLHQTAVNCLRFDEMGLKFVSGGLDTEMVVADLVTRSGACRLSGHAGPVTDAHFMQRFRDVLVSCSKDTQIKFWDISTQFCFKTIVDHRTEVWGLALMRNDAFLCAGAADNSLRVYSLAENTEQTQIVATNVDSIDMIDDSASPLKCTYVGVIQRTGRGRTMNLISDISGGILGCHGTDSKIELFYFCEEEESLKRLTKRLKKLSTVEESDIKSREISLTDKIRRLPIVKTEGKVKSFDLILGNGKEVRVVSSFANNLIKLFVLNYSTKNAEASLMRNIQQQGHHSEVRSVCFSSDSLAIASGSGEGVKLWNRGTQACLRTVTLDYALCVCFAPGDRHLLVGLKSGALLIVDIVNGEIVGSVQAHAQECWSISLMPDLRGCVTGGGDKKVKFWNFELVTDKEDPNKKNLSLIHTRGIALDESVLCVRLSRNNKYIAAALLDNTVKIFFADTFKFYLSLYGHNLPVLTMDISGDSTLIITGSADRNVKIWGMDFGDCHRSIFAHDDSVMCVQFIPKTHMFFSCGKDGKIKQWDADTFQKILTLPGHFGEAYSLSVSPNGKFVVSSGADKTLRLFERTDEPLVLQDAQEEEREEIENRTLATGDGSDATAALPGLKLPSKKTVGAEKACESILECLEVLTTYEPESTEIPPLMAAFEAKSADEFIINVLNRIRPSDMEEGLVLLPFSAVCEVLKKIPHLVVTRKDQTELLCKVTLFIFKIHQKPILANQTLLETIHEIKTNLEVAITELRDLVGFNFHGMQLLQWGLEAQEGIDLFTDATQEFKTKQEKKKRKQAMKRHIQMISG